MGKRYSEEEKRRIQELAQQGYPYVSIAHQLGRSTNAIRNIIHREYIKTQTTRTIQQLKKEKQTLQQQKQQIENELKQLEKRRKQIKQALQTEEIQFNRKLSTELTIARADKIID